MSRKIIQINEEKCIGCGLCVNACQQSALKIINGKAKLMSNDYCDGLGNCLPKCPVNAISFSDIDISFKENPKTDSASLSPMPSLSPMSGMTASSGKFGGCPGSGARSIERPAVKFEEIPKQLFAQLSPPVSAPAPVSACGCPGSHTKTIERPDEARKTPIAINTMPTNVTQINQVQTNLNQWPVQIKLVPVNAPYFKNANILIAADCSAYAYGNFHNDFMKNRITLIGCPKLDAVDYAEKLSAILESNTIQSVTIVRMEVPCCAGIENAVKTALKNCSKMIQWQLITISTDGRILDAKF